MRRARLAGLLVWLLSAPFALAQDSSPGVETVAILTVDQDALFQKSAWGRSIRAELETEGARIQAENQRLFDQLSAEEAALAQLRGEMEPAIFRRQAEAFDTRATQIRRERAQVVADLNDRAEASRAEFYRAALPVMAQMMQERGALVVLEQRSVFVAAQSVDITDDLVVRLDAELGSGGALAPLTEPAAAPETVAPTDALPAPIPSD